MDEFELAGIALNGARPLGGSGVEQDFQFLADISHVDIARDVVLDFDEVGEAAELFFARNLVFSVAGGGAGAGGIGKGEGGVEADVADGLAGAFELRLGFSGKADNDVGGEGDTGDGFSDSGGDFFEALDGVDPPHFAQHFVVSALDGQVDVLHDGRAIADGLHKLLAKVAGVGGGVADALDAGDFGDFPEELSERDIAFEQVFAVAIDGLAEKGDFLRSLVGEFADFFEDFGGRSASLAAPGFWDDAVGAELVAAVLDGDEGFQLSGSAEVAAGDVGDDFAFSFGKFGPLSEAAGLEGFGDEAGEEGKVAGAEDEIDVGISVADFVGAGLGHAAANAEDHIWVVALEGAEFSHEAERFIFGLFANAAGV